ncbi:monocarboxylate transporter 13-like [Mercenaria mercenaria]|uniref:monocarboxylate transporter 13-like n=1 Tax=Mercenaria mercenaria TaxID=6596 RepID=UPI00234F6BD4|nr:monocarboxylate transporter 13-like [Mercenaria mercenaria]
MENFTQMQRFEKWLLFLITLLLMAIIFGPIFSFGAVFITMMDTFQTDRAETAAVQSIVIGMTFSFGVISGALIGRFGPTMMIFVASVVVPLGFGISYFAKHIIYLYISIGIVTGVGNSLVFSSCIVIVERVFEGPKRLLCLAVLNTSTVVTAIFYPYFIKWLTEMYSLNGIFLILAGISLNIFVLFTMCWTNRVAEKNVQSTKAELDDCPESSRKGCNSLIDIMFDCFSHANKLFHVPYALVLIASSLSLASLDGYVGVMFDIALWKKMTSSQGYITSVVYYSCTAVSCVAAGILKQKKGVNSLIYPILSTFCGCCGQLFILSTSNYSVYMIGTALTGMTYGGVIASTYTVIVQMVSQEQVPVATGLFTTLEGLVALGVGPLYGNIRDISGSYRSVLVTVTCVQALSSALFTLALITNRRRKKRLQPNSSSEIIASTRL